MRIHTRARKRRTDEEFSLAYSTVIPTWTYTHSCGYTQQPEAGCSLNYPAVISLLLMAPSLMVSMISSYWLCNFSLAVLGWVGKWIWCNKQEQLHFHIYYVFHSFFLSFFSLLLPLIHTLLNTDTWEVTSIVLSIVLHQ